MSYLTLNNIVTLKSGLELRGNLRSLKLVPFESLGAVSYSPSIVTIELPSCLWDWTGLITLINLFF